MDIVNQIHREIEAISYGIFGVHVVENVGPEADIARLLPTKIAHENVELNDIQSVGQYLIPYRIKMNKKLGRASINRLSGMLVGTVYELLKDDNERWENHFSHRPEMQFLRYIRNGFFHGNQFDFKHGSPDNAKWRGWEITSDMEGDLVFTELKDIAVPSPDEVSPDEVRRFNPELEEGFMEAGDAFALVNDVKEIVEEELNSLLHVFDL